MNGMCEICKVPVTTKAATPTHLKTKYWKYKKFPDISKGVIMFCGAQHAHDYQQQLTKD